MTNPTPTRPPTYARIALALFGLSAAMLLVCGWLVWRSPAPRDLLRRGPGAMINAPRPEGLHRADPDCERRLACGTFERASNELGQPYDYTTIPITEDGACFRDDGIDPPVFAVAVGDSFTLGHRVAMADGWVEQLEQRLGRDVANLAVSGTGVSQYRCILEKYGLDLQPQVVLIGTFVNDWLDEAMFDAWRCARAQFGGQVDFPRSRPWFDAVRRNAYRLPGEDWQHPTLGHPTHVTINGVNYRFDASAYAAQNLRSPTIAHGRDLAFESIAAMAKQARARGAACVVVIFPAREHVYHERAVEALRYAADQPADTFCRQTAVWCASQNIPTVNLLPVFRAAAVRGERIYFAEDGHLTPHGYAVTAEAIHAAIDRLPPAPPRDN